MKEVVFLGTALRDLRAFPKAARRNAGLQIDRVQRGFEPDDWKPISSVGAGVREIRLRGSDGVFRIIYAAKLEEAVFVFHCFQKKTHKTRREDIALAARRYRNLLEGSKT